jgi:hypothetical protein
MRSLAAIFQKEPYDQKGLSDTRDSTDGIYNGASTTCAVAPVVARFCCRCGKHTLCHWRRWYGRPGGGGRDPAGPLYLSAHSRTVLSKLTEASVRPSGI